MPKLGMTAVLLPVPGADALLRRVAERFPEAVRAGVPAHVTVLHPFLPASEVDDAVLGELTALFARWEPLRVAFTMPEQSGEPGGSARDTSGFVALRPEPIEPLRELTAQVRARWPHLVPYGGAHGEVEPHLTVALNVSTEDARSVRQDIARHLPPPAELAEAWLVAYDGAWSRRARLPLGS